MKKVIALILVALMTISLFACTKSNNEVKEPEFVKPENTATVVSVKINPEFRFYLDAAGAVLAIRPMNDDAKALQSKLDATKTDIADVVTDLIAKADAEGFIKEGAEIKVAVVEAASDALKIALEAGIITAAQTVVEGLGKSVTVVADDEAEADPTAAPATDAPKPTDEVVVRDSYTYVGHAYIASGSDLKGYTLYFTLAPNGNYTTRNEDFENITITDPCVEIWRTEGGYYMLPQDYSSCSTKVQNKCTSFLDYFDAGMYGLSENPGSWADCFSEPYFSTLGGVEVGGVKFIPDAGGKGPGDPIYSVTVGADGTITMGAAQTTKTIDFTVNSLTWSANHKTLTVNATIEGNTNSYVLDLR